MKRLAILLAITFVHSAIASAQDARIDVHAGQVTHRLTRTMTGACLEDVNHEVYGGIYSQMVFGESFQEPPPPIPVKGSVDEVSGMWRPVRRGSATGRFAIVKENRQDRPFTGSQSQRIVFESGPGETGGEIGIENRGLNRWGMYFVEGKPYEGYLWVRCQQTGMSAPPRPTPVYVAMESGDGSKVYAETRLEARSGDWQRLDFTLTPNATDPAGRLAIKLRGPGSVVLGHAFLQPGPWGRFKGLPVRKDVAEALVAQGLTVLR